MGTLGKGTEDGIQAAMASYNHPMNGAVGVAFSKHLAGLIADENYPAFEHFTICPVLPKKLDHVSFVYESVKGTIKSEWIKKEDSIVLNIQIPVNTQADVYVPVYRTEKEARIFLNEEKIYDQVYLFEEYKPCSEIEKEKLCSYISEIRKLQLEKYVIMEENYEDRSYLDYKTIPRGSSPDGDRR